MEFTNYKCPVCDKQFKSDDDVVVCPECGTPHHRECYDKLEHCFYEEKHSDGFTFEAFANENKAENESGDGETVICPNCKEENPKATFYCNKCGFPLNEQDRKENTQNTSQQNQQPMGNGMPPFGVPFGANPQQMNMAFDPMAGFKSDDPIAENVTAGEMSKFVGKNTQYFLRIFGNIKKFNKSRFNFSAFIFSGAYFLYRKMIGFGILFSFLIIAITVGQTLITLTPAYQELYTQLLNIESTTQGVSSFGNISQLFSGFSTQDILFLYSFAILNVLRGIVMIVCGFIANRSYYKHCTAKINSLKKTEENVNINESLEKKGGVNLPLAICLAAAYIAISYIPIFL